MDKHKNRLHRFYNRLKQKKLKQLYQNENNHSIKNSPYHIFKHLENSIGSFSIQSFNNNSCFHNKKQQLRAIQKRFATINDYIMDFIEFVKDEEFQTFESRLKRYREQNKEVKVNTNNTISKKTNVTGKEFIIDKLISKLQNLYLNKLIELGSDNNSISNFNAKSDLFITQIKEKSKLNDIDVNELIKRFEDVYKSAVKELEYIFDVKDINVLLFSFLDKIERLLLNLEEKK